MRIFTIKPFRKWAQNNDLTDDLLRDAVNEVEKGIVDANLGGNLYKKRMLQKAEVKAEACEHSSYIPLVKGLSSCLVSKKQIRLTSHRKKKKH